MSFEQSAQAEYQLAVCQQYGLWVEPQTDQAGEYVMDYSFCRPQDAKRLNAKGAAFRTTTAMQGELDGLTACHGCDTPYEMEDLTLQLDTDGELLCSVCEEYY